MITVLATVGSGIELSVIDSLNLQKEYNIIGCNRDKMFRLIVIAISFIK